MIRHLVLCRFRADVDVAARADLHRRLEGLRDRLDGMGPVALGPNASPEGLGRGFDHGFAIDFRDAAARDAYLADEVHGAVGADIVAALEGGLDGLLVFDLEVPDSEAAARA